MKLFRWPLRYVPTVKLAGYFPMPAARSGRKYYHETCALHLHLYDGKLTMGRTVYSFRAGDVTITPPGIVSDYQIAHGGHHWCVHFDPARSTARRSSVNLPVLLHVASGDATHLRERLSIISDTLKPWSFDRDEAELASAAAGTLFQSFLLQLARQRRKRPEKTAARLRSQVRLEEVKEHLEQNFQHRIRLPSLVALSGLSPNFFALRFRQRFGTTVGGYLLHLRMEMARNLLLSTDQAIKEIAFECGIPDANYFNKQFRRINGISPSRYRIRNRVKW